MHVQSIQRIRPQNPEVFNVLFAVTNFANFWHTLGATVKSVSEAFIAQAALMSTEFGPVASSSSSGITTVQDIGLGLSIAGTLVGLIPELAPVGAGISIGETALCLPLVSRLHLPSLIVPLTTLPTFRSLSVLWRTTWSTLFLSLRTPRSTTFRKPVTTIQTLIRSHNCCTLVDSQRRQAMSQLKCLTS